MRLGKSSAIWATTRTSRPELDSYSDQTKPCYRTSTKIKILRVVLGIERNELQLIYRKIRDRDTKLGLIKQFHFWKHLGYNVEEFRGKIFVRLVDTDKGTS